MENKEIESEQKNIINNESEIQKVKLTELNTAENKTESNLQDKTSYLKNKKFIRHSFRHLRS